VTRLSFGSDLAWTRIPVQACESLIVTFGSERGALI
jgi:hypothetical protein